MLNNEKIILMTKLSLYEQKNQKTHWPGVPVSDGLRDRPDCGGTLRLDGHFQHLHQGRSASAPYALVSEKSFL